MLECRIELADEGLEHAPIVGGQAGTNEHELSAIGQIEVLRCSWLPGSAGTGVPLDASISHWSPSARRIATASRPNVERKWLSSASSGSGSPTSPPATRASDSASALVRR
jgi:hypothetical protein